MKQLIEFLARTLNISPESVAELLFKKSDEDGSLTEEMNEDAIPKLLDLDKARISKVKEEGKGSFDNGYKKAEREVSIAWEKKLRENFGIEELLIGDDLIEALKSKVAPSGGNTEDDIKRHPTFVSMERAMLAKIKEEQENGAKALEEYKSQMSAAEIRQAAKAAAKERLLAMKPVLEEEAEIAATRIEDFLREFDGYEYQRLEDGTIMPLKEGKRIENAHSHPISFDDLVKATAGKRFKFQVQNPKGNEGNEGGGSQKFNGKIPASEGELWEAYNKLDADGQRALLDAYEKAHGEIVIG